MLHIVGSVVLLHLAEIAIWGLFYLWRGPMQESAFYFSEVTYTTFGYGDVVLAKLWRLLAPIVGLMGALMCSICTDTLSLQAASITLALGRGIRML
jgi:hypothetical protein